MKKHLQEVIKELELPPAFVAHLCGFSRSQVGNWINNPEKYPIPTDRKKLLQEKLRELGKVLSNIELK